jgi:hypothetical protein
LSVFSKNHVSVNRKVLNRHVGERNIWEFKHLLNTETWQEVFTETEVNVKFKVFMNLVPHLFALAFPLEFSHRKKPSRNGWISQGIKISGKKLYF